MREVGKGRKVDERHVEGMKIEEKARDGMGAKKRNIDKGGEGKSLGTNFSAVGHH
jgi:hypothetical protein